MKVALSSFGRVVDRESPISVVAFGHAPDGVETLGGGMMDAIVRSRLKLVPGVGDGTTIHAVVRAADLVAVDPLATRQDWFHVGQYAADGSGIVLWSEGLSAFIGLNLFFRYESGVDYFRATRPEDFEVIAAGRILDRRRQTYTDGRTRPPWTRLLCIDAKDGRGIDRWLRVGGIALHNHKGRGWALVANKIDVPSATMLHIARTSGVKGKLRASASSGLWRLELTDRQAGLVRERCKVLPAMAEPNGGRAKKNAKGFQKPG